MISPSNRMLFWVAVVLIPLGLLAAIAPEATVLVLLGGLLLAIVIVFDGWIDTHRLDGLSAEGPSIARLTKDRDGEIDIHLNHQSVKLRRVKVGLYLPVEIRPAHEELMVNLPAESERSLIAWPCIPNCRGRFRLGRVFFEMPSRLGLWLVRSSSEINTEIRVYPNLLSERKHAAALFLNRGGIGMHAQRQIGKGRDFEQLRDYIPGDGYDEIHWKATAKRGKPVTRMFQIERTQEIYVIIDASRLSARTTSSDESDSADEEFIPAQNTLEHFINSALILTLAAEKQGDLYGLVTFSNQVNTFLRAQSGKTHYNACRDALYTLQTQPVTPDYNDLCTFLRLRLRRRALLVFLTNLDDPVLAENFTQGIDLLCRQHLVMVNIPQSPNVQPLFSNPDVHQIGDVYQQLAGHYRWKGLRELQKTFQRRGVQLSITPNEALSADIVSQYVRVKQRQLL